MHVFEKAGLGKAPFRCIGYERRTYQACPGAPVQVGAACQYCYTGISDCFVIKARDGRTFVVGSDCVRKTGDASLERQAKTIPAYREAQRVKRQAKAASDMTALQEIISEHALELAVLPHPRREWLGQSLLDYAAWMLQNAGASGRAKALRAVKLALAPPPA